MVEGPGESYSSRLDKAQRRKATLTDQLLADSQVTQVSSSLPAFVPPSFWGDPHLSAELVCTCRLAKSDLDEWWIFGMLCLP